MDGLIIAGGLAALGVVTLACGTCGLAWRLLRGTPAGAGLKRALCGAARTVFVLAAITAVGVACAALGPFWGLVAVCGTVGAAVLTGVVLEAVRDEPPPGTVDELDAYVERALRDDPEFRAAYEAADDGGGSG